MYELKVVMLIIAIPLLANFIENLFKKKEDEL